MIMDTLDHWESYTGLSAGIATGLRCLVQEDLVNKPDGRYEIDGDNVFLMLSTYTTKPLEEALPEAHEKYIDIQYLISGQELVGVAPLNSLGSPCESRPDQDIAFYGGQTQPLLLGGDRFMIFYPQDAHAPCICVDNPETVRKAVVKVRV